MSTEYTKLPSFTSWMDDYAERYAIGSHRFYVDRILLPNKYPNYTFCTEQFRYSVKLPEIFGQSLKSYSESAQKAITAPSASNADVELMSLSVWVYNGKPKLDVLTKMRSQLEQDMFKPNVWAIPVFKESYYDMTYLRSYSDSFTPSDEYTDIFAVTFGMRERSEAVSSEAPTSVRKARKTSPK